MNTDIILDFFVEYYIWFIIGGAILLLAIIGFIADKKQFFSKKKNKGYEKNDNELNEFQETNDGKLNEFQETNDVESNVPQEITDDKSIELQEINEKNNNINAGNEEQLVAESNNLEQIIQHETINNEKNEEKINKIEVSANEPNEINKLLENADDSKFDEKHDYKISNEKMDIEINDFNYSEDVETTTNQLNDDKNNFTNEINFVPEINNAIQSNNLFEEKTMDSEFPNEQNDNSVIETIEPNFSDNIITNIEDDIDKINNMEFDNNSNTDNSTTENNNVHISELNREENIKDNSFETMFGDNPNQTVQVNYSQLKEMVEDIIAETRENFDEKNIKNTSDNHYVENGLKTDFINKTEEGIKDIPLPNLDNIAVDAIRQQDEDEDDVWKF